METKGGRRETLTKVRLRAAALCCSATLAGTAHAQTASTGAPGTKGETQVATADEIIVTAQKRAQRAQDVPIALSVIDEKALRDTRVVSIEDLSRVAPNLQIVNTGGAGSYTAVARGVTNLVSSPESSSVLGFYLDEAPISAFGASLPDAALFDLQRVEFLRGPQGTLFGEGSEAGTLRAITNKPDSHDFSARGEATDFGTRGGSNSWNARGVVNIPLVSDRLAARIVGSYRNDGGWIDVPDRGAKDVNRVRQWDVRGALRWTPSDRLTVDLSWTHDDFRARDAFVETSEGVYQPSGLGPLIPGVAAGPVRQAQPNRYRYDLVNGTIDYGLGFADLVSSTSYYRQQGSSLQDLSPAVPPYLVSLGLAAFAAAPGFASQTSADQSKLITEELRLVSKAGQPFTWTVGSFFRHQERDTNQELSIALLAPPLSLADQVAMEHTRNNAYAIFAQADYKLTSTLTATAGLRYYDDDRKTSTTSIAAPGAPPSTFSPTAGDHAFSPNFVLSWEPSRQATLFVKAARGFRQGGTNGANAFSATIPQSYGPESLWSYEAGAKTTFVPWLTANVYVFYNDWTDLQVSAIQGFFGFTQNGGKARSVGAEAEIAATPTPNLSFGGSLSYTDAKLTSVTAQASAAGALNDNRIPYVPRFSTNLFADYHHPLSGDWSGSGRIEYQHRDSTFSDIVNRTTLRNDSIDRFNLRVGINDARYRVSVFAENVTDSHDTSSKTFVLLPTFVTQVPLRPRTIGVTVGAAF